MRLPKQRKRYAGGQFATVLDGASQYWSKSSPSNLDLNGSEMITAADDRGFESTVGNWTGAGNHSVSRSTTDKRTGTASMAVVASAAGDSTTNYVTLAFANFDTVVSGSKYTVEGYARSNTATTTITMVIGSKTVTSGTLSTVAGTFTKFVLNFQATASELSQGIKLYLNKAATVYVDDISFTQAFDLMVLGLVNLNASAPVATANILQRRKSGGNPIFDLNVDSGVNLRFVFRDTDGLALSDFTSALAVNDGKWHLVATTINRLGGASSLMLYKDGSSSASTVSATTGKVVFSTENLNIGANSTPANFFQGYVGQAQIVRFAVLPSDITNTIFQISNTWKRNGLPNVYLGGQIVAWYDWKNGGMDKSGNNNHLTGTGSPTITRI